MMEKTDSVIIVLQVIIVIIGLYLAFFKSYFTEKGKQLAIKEDLEEITNKVEKIKSEIQVFHHNRISFNSEKRAQIFDYYSKYAAWKTAVFNLSPGDISEIRNRQTATKKCEDAYLEFRVATSKVELFIDDSLFYELNGECTVALIQLASVIDGYLIKAESGSKNKTENLANTSIDVELRIKNNTEFINEIVGYINDVTSEKVKSINVLDPLENKRKTVLRNCLKEISGDF